MTKRTSVAIFVALGVICAAPAQESPTPAPAPTPSPARSVRISFVPPPMQGTISLGIYDAEGKLVRVLKQEAEVDEFEVGDDGLSIRWDGKDEDSFDLAPGKYRAHGYVVAPMKIEPLPISGAVLGPPILETPIRVKLVRNPLQKSETPIVDLDLGHDDENAYLKTGEGLPLVTIANLGDVESAAFINRSDQALTILLRRPSEAVLVKVSAISKMMAFDCGEFELK
ncbi:MAG: hypothetical protein ABR514_03005 [Chthoniobacterales bacterium]